VKINLDYRGNMGHIYRWLEAVCCSIAFTCAWANNEPKWKN